jgi:hypothetical protein
MQVQRIEATSACLHGAHRARRAMPAGLIHDRRASSDLEAAKDVLESEYA